MMDTIMTPSDKANRDFWVARRQGAPRPPTPLSVVDFVQEANRQLAADPTRSPGTRFTIVATPGAEAHPSWEGPDTMRPTVQRIVQGMTSRFELNVPFRIDR